MFPTYGGPESRRSEFGSCRGINVAQPELLPLVLLHGSSLLAGRNIQKSKEVCKRLPTLRYVLGWTLLNMGGEAGPNKKNTQL